MLIHALPGYNQNGPRKERESDDEVEVDEQHISAYARDGKPDEQKKRIPESTEEIEGRPRSQLSDVVRRVDDNLGGGHNEVDFYEQLRVRDERGWGVRVNLGAPTRKLHPACKMAEPFTEMIDQGRSRAVTTYRVEKFVDNS